MLARRPDLRLDVCWAASLPSTMDVVSAAGEAGAPSGLVVVANAQTAGRGRRGREWSSPDGAGVYFSFLARPTRDAGLLTLAAGVAVRAGMGRSTGLAADLKWPNDLLVGLRKVAGILAEGSRLGTADAAVTIGVGINLRAAVYPPDVAARATSIEQEIHRRPDRGAVLAAVLEELVDATAALEAGRAGDILQAWRAASPSAVGTMVEWSDATGGHRGSTAGVDDAGALLVRTPAGTARIVAGELTWHLNPAS
jgi:BirA family biotin operon repressor/biotin-[acetyl-CoA-carboxylase] ligase